MEQKELSFNDYVRASIASGVKPLEPVFYPIMEVDGNSPIAFRSSTIIHSIIIGDLNEENYIHVSDNRLCGIELLKHNLQHAIASIKAFDKANKRLDFVAVRCPSQFIEKTSLYEVVKVVLEHNPSIDPSRIVVEFPENLMDIDEKKVKDAILDMKLLKVRTALQGVGKEDFKISRLLSVPVDLAFLDKSACDWAGDRNKPQVFNALLSYIKAMGVDSIAQGNDEKKKEMHFSEAIGFMYENTEPVKLEEAIAMVEEEAIL